VPTYAYACTECGHRFEQVQSFTDDALTVCPECEGRLRKVFSNVGIVFKGSGFYRTDSRSGATANGSKATENGADKSVSADKTSSTDKSSDAGSSSVGSGKQSDSSSSTAKKPASSSPAA
jgi:putative FmdB family regulatory protein